MHRLRSFLAILLLPAVCWLFTNAVVNQHSHLLRNGEIITHAHPYTPDRSNSSPFQSHQHSPLTFQIFGQLSNPLTILGFAAAILSVFLFRSRIVSSRIFVNPIVDLFLDFISGRAPPVMN